MSKLTHYVARHFFSIFYLLIAGSFLLLLVELIWTGHWDGIQLVAPVASGIGVVLALLALVTGPRWRNLLAVLFLLLSITGIIGTVEHNEERGGEDEAGRPTVIAASAGAAGVAAPQQQESGEDGERGERGEGENIPPLAPLSLAGTSMLAVVGLLADGRRKDVRLAA